MNKKCHLCVGGGGLRGSLPENMKHAIDLVDQSVKIVCDYHLRMYKGFYQEISQEECESMTIILE
jgi:hypothetical protein